MNHSEHLEFARPAAPRATCSSGDFTFRSTIGKRFTVRDGFHLKTRNAEAHAVIDEQLTARGETSAWLSAVEFEHENLCELVAGPSSEEIISALPSPKRKVREDTKHNNNNEDQLQHEAVGKCDSTAAEDGGTRCATNTSTAFAVLDQLLQPENSSLQTISRKVRATLRAPAEWLIYRHRPSETQRRKQRKVDKLLDEMLHEPELHTETDEEANEMRVPRRPRCQSTLGSTYSQRVAVARPIKQQSPGSNHKYKRELLQPLTETERGLLRSREDHNKAVDKLLVSLFSPTSASPAPAAAMTSLIPIAKPTTPSNRFATRRSVIRNETALALRSRNLVSRMNELRSLPQLLEQMEALQVWKRQQNIAEHGADIVARNRANPTLQVLQKPSQTPLLPSATDHKVHLANKRKQELDAAKEESVRRLVIRWQTRREQRAEHERRIHVQSQWLLLVALAESSEKWLTKFHEFRHKRSSLVRVSMAKRLQRYWRQRTLVKRNSLQLLHFAPSTPLSSAFFRMPVVINAVATLQQSIRDWLDRKHHRERKSAVELIVTAWFEFQDVKFRRIILRFRKRVRDFQVMWRAWRAITAARIKLLLLVWAKVERKIKRRHGITSSHRAVSFSLPNELKPSEDGALAAGKGMTLLDMLQRTTVERPMNQQQKQLEDMHRHFRNGGAVHMPISAVSPGPHSSASTSSPSVGFQPSPPSPTSRKSTRPRPTENATVRQDLQLRNNMGEEFQLVMYDVYTTRKNLSPNPKSPAFGAASSHDTKRSPGKPVKASPRGPLLQAPPLPLSSTTTSTVPVPPPSKKVPQQVKVTVLRKLLSEKRKLYSDARDHGREAWAAARKQLRSEAFRYDVLDELTAFQQLQAKYATFLLLQSISETEMVRLIHETQTQVNAVASAASFPLRRKSLQSAGRKSHGLVSIDSQHP